MTKEERLEFQQEIRQDIKSAIETELGAYKIPKEQHYQDHLWLKDWRDWQNNIKNSVWKSIVGIAIMAISALLLYGFIFFGKANWGGK